MAKNEMCVAPDYGGATLIDSYNQIATMVKEKTIHAMQTKDREWVKKEGQDDNCLWKHSAQRGMFVIKEDI